MPKGKSQGKKLSEEEVLKRRAAFKPPPEETEAQFAERLKRYIERNKKKPEAKK